MENLADNFEIYLCSSDMTTENASFGDQMISPGGGGGGGELAVNFDIHLSGMTTENASFGVCVSRRSHQLTSYRKRC